MRMSVGVPGVAGYFEHFQVKPLIKGQAVKLKTTIEDGRPFGVESHLQSAESRSEQHGRCS